MVDSLIDMFKLSESEAVKTLENVDFDFDRAVEKIHRVRQKEKEK